MFLPNPPFPCSELRKRNELFAKKIGTKSKLHVVQPQDKKAPIARWIVWVLAFAVGGPRTSCSLEARVKLMGCAVVFQFVQALVDAFAAPVLKTK